jgi:hypothetical protein
MVFFDYCKGLFSICTSTARVVICAQGPDDGVFQDPDIYCLSLIELRGSSASPLLRIGRFVGSNDDADALLWTRILHPGKSHYFVQPRTFAAALVWNDEYKGGFYV